MASFKLSLTDTAVRGLERLDLITKERIGRKLKYYVDSGDPMRFAEPLIHPSLGQYRFRIGHYRAIFDRQGSHLFILRVGHRREIYQ